MSGTTSGPWTPPGATIGVEMHLVMHSKAPQRYQIRRLHVHQASRSPMPDRCCHCQSSCRHHHRRTGDLLTNTRSQKKLNHSEHRNLQRAGRGVNQEGNHTAYQENPGLRWRQRKSRAAALAAWWKQEASRALHLIAALRSGSKAIHC